MATVYLAEDLKHHRHVAAKVLSPELSTFADGLLIRATLPRPSGTDEASYLGRPSGADASCVESRHFPYFIRSSFKLTAAACRDRDASHRLQVIQDAP